MVRIGKVGREVVKSLDSHDQWFDNQDETSLIITISDTSKNQSRRFDSDNTINLSSLIVNLDHFCFCLSSRDKVRAK